jgi:hypothetical protein
MNKIMKPVVAAAIPLLTALGSYIATGGPPNAAEWSLAITGFVTAIVVAVLTAVLPDESDAVLATWGKAIGAADPAGERAYTVLLRTREHHQSPSGNGLSGCLNRACDGLCTEYTGFLVQNTPDIH